MSHPVMLADCKRAVASLNSLNNDDLDLIMNDDEKIENILLGLDQSYLKEIEVEKENLLTSNNSLAEENLLREPELMEGREKLQQLSEEGEALTKTVEEKMKDLREKGGDMSLETALALLQTAASEMEEESDKVAKKFLDNEDDLDSFLDQFLAKRKIMHLRLVKAEKLSKILSRDPALIHPGGNYMNIPPMNINSSYFPGIPQQPPPQPTSIVPYPTGAIGMPMPPPMSYFPNHY